MRSRQGIADANLAPVGRKNLISLSLPAKRRSERFNSHCICVQTALAVTTVLATRILILDDSFSLAKKSFEISQAGARQLVRISAARLAAIPAGESPANRDAMGQRRGLLYPPALM
jgi:hypothetical protein